MKIFNQGSGLDKKVNFVDENNIVLGYDMSQSCCENADWFIADKVLIPKDYEALPDKPRFPDSGILDLPQYFFDTKFFEKNEGQYFDGGGMVVFKITNGKDEKFIHLYNVHNGYYAHGFDMIHENNRLRDGLL